jgi:hypothetical protein
VDLLVTLALGPVFGEAFVEMAETWWNGVVKAEH